MILIKYEINHILLSKISVTINNCKFLAENNVAELSFFTYLCDAYVLFKTTKGIEFKRDTKLAKTERPLSCRMKLVETRSSDVTAVNWTRT
jgi:hypothetical protein